MREPSVGEKKALKERGIVFLPVAMKSYAQVVAENPEHFSKDEVAHANSQGLEYYIPPVAMLVGLNPKTLALPDSFSKSQDDQLKMIDDYSQTLRAEFPDARAVMLPVTGYAQADIAYKNETGGVLFRNYFARALDHMRKLFAADVGRHNPSHLFYVGACGRDLRPDFVGAVPAVVFIGNK